VDGLCEAVEDSAIAVKADDAAVPIHLRDDRLWGGCTHLNDDQRGMFFQKHGHCLLVAIRRLALGFWGRRITRSFVEFMRATHGAEWHQSKAAQRDREVGRDCIWRASSCDWWEWLAGSALFYWRWPTYARILARDGHPVWWLADPPPS